VVDAGLPEAPHVAFDVADHPLSVREIHFPDQTPVAEDPHDVPTSLNISLLHSATRIVLPWQPAKILARRPFLRFYVITWKQHNDILFVLHSQSTICLPRNTGEATFVMTYESQDHQSALFLEQCDSLGR